MCYLSQEGRGSHSCVRVCVYSRDYMDALQIKPGLACMQIHSRPALSQMQMWTFLCSLNGSNFNLGLQLIATRPPHNPPLLLSFCPTLYLSSSPALLFPLF